MPVRKCCYRLAAPPYLRVRFFILHVISPHWIQVHSLPGVCTPFLNFSWSPKSGLSYLLVLRTVLIDEVCSICFLKYSTCIMRAPGFRNPAAHSVKQNQSWTLFVLPHTPRHTGKLDFQSSFLLCSFKISLT